MGKPKGEKETGPSQAKQAEKAQSIVQKHYVVKGLVGKGSHGTVHKVRRIADGLICAMKECTVVHMSQEERDEAVKQIHLLTTVRHQNVIKYYDAFVEGDKLYTVMEYCERGDLAKLIRNRAQLFDEAQVWSYFIQILRGLVALHSYQLIHRDIKSANVMLLDNNSIKIGDLGVPKLLKQSMGTTQIGTPHYMAPEIWKNEPYTFSSDMWALGCVLYELAALSIPFRGQTLFDLRAKLLQGEYPPIPAHFSSGLTTVLKHLLNTDQAWRLSSKEVLIHPLVRAHYHLAPPSIRLYVPRRKTMGEQPEPTSPQSRIPKVNLASSATGLKVRAPSPVRIALPTSNGPVVSVKRQSGVASVRVSAPRIPKSAVSAGVRPPRAVLSSRGNDVKPVTTVAAKPVSESADPKPKALGKPLPSLSPMVNNKRLKRLSLAGPKTVSPKEQNAALNRRFKHAYVRSPEALDTVEAVGSGEDDQHSQPSPTASEPVNLGVSLSPRSPPSGVPAESTAVLESPQPPKVLESPQPPKVLESPQPPKVLESPQPPKVVNPPEELVLSEKPKVLNGTLRNAAAAPTFVPRVRDAPIVLQPVATKIPSAPKSVTPRAPLSAPRVPSPRAPLSAPKGPLIIASRSALGTSGTTKSPVTTPKASARGPLAAPKATPTIPRAPATASKIPQAPGLVPVKTKLALQRKDEHRGKLPIAK